MEVLKLNGISYRAVKVVKKLEHYPSVPNGMVHLQFLDPEDGWLYSCLWTQNWKYELTDKDISCKKCMKILKGIKSGGD